MTRRLISCALAALMVSSGCAELSDEDGTDPEGDVDEPNTNTPVEMSADQMDEMAADDATDVDTTDPTIEDGDDDGTDLEEEDEAEVTTAMDSGLDLDETTPDTAIADSPELQETIAKLPSKIHYVLIIVKENHTFDNYFTGFPGATSSFHATKLKNGKRVSFLRPVAPPDTLPSGPGHTHAKALAAYRNGHMDGFSVNPGMTPYIRYTKSQIPNYWKYARDYVLADHYFSTSLAPSAPGHEVFWFSRSTTIDNPKCHLPGGKGCGTGCSGTHLTATTFNPRTGKMRKVKPCFDLPSLPDHLPNGFTWFDYGAQPAKQIKSLRNVSTAAHYAPSGQLLKDMRNGKLHNLMIAHVTGGEISEHPRNGPCKGERFTTDAINAAMKLPQWKNMAIIVTWDDWGGFYDHVKPPVHTSQNGNRFGRGFRLPLLIISPYAKKGFVLKNTTEQASVPKLVEDLWGMKYMSTRNSHARDGVAGSLMGAFDFSQEPRGPIELPRRVCPGDHK
jgi:phospholipase C